MLALQLNQPSFFMGLGADGQPVMPVTAEAVLQQIRDRAASIRAKLVTFGIPGAVLTGGATMLVFAGAFKLAGTERVWLPALLVGGATAAAGLLGIAAVASATPVVTPSPVTPLPVATTSSAPATTLPAAF